MKIPNTLRILILAMACTVPVMAQESSKPNILLILVDDMGYSDPGFMGSEIQTPNLDRLSSEGVTFTNFANCAKCETSRTSLMTGRYHVEEGAQGGQRSITIPENLALAGYQNFAVGKWHIFGTPMKRGFDRYFGFLEGATNFFTGEGTQGSYSYRLDEQEFNDFPEDFYSTVAFTDYGIQFISGRDKERPFFMYMAYNAPHYPLQAPKETVMKYKGKYMNGWNALRQKRFKRMQEMGLIDPTLVPPDQGWDIGGWEGLSQEEKEDMDLRMATYVAMIDIVDQQVGRLVASLKAEGIFEDTLIIFLSDNGACPFDRTRKPTKEHNYMPWDGRSYWCYPDGWARACNTPFKGLKQSQYEGGISTPVVAHWPNGITTPGTRNLQRGHLVDLHATFRELAGVGYPTHFDWQTGQTDNKELGPARGISLTPAFTGKARPEHETLYQNFRNDKTALWWENWKLVNFNELYDLEHDRMETRNLRSAMPEKFNMMRAKFTAMDIALNEGKALEKTETGKRSRILNWMVLGPFDDLSDQGGVAFEVARFPMDTPAWQPLDIAPKGDQFDLKKAFGKGEKRSAFVRTTLVAAENTQAVLELAGSDKVLARLNGVILQGNKNTITLNRGDNELMLKVIDRKSRWWTFSCKIKKDYQPVSGLKAVAQ
jgi:arylsulfatase A-like enzyme